MGDQVALLRQRAALGRLARSDLPVALFLLLAAIGFLWEVLFGGKVLLPAENLFIVPPFQDLAAKAGVSIPHNALISDAVLQNLGWKSFARDTFLSGSIPLWNPHLFSGVPFLAAGQYAVLYPPGMLFYLLPL
ncbi:MAG: hypothetical protein HY675_00820, partial [Chloroflexi bacterium]|nr:hypothetical protein [Chloroflexota bacterium]